MIQVGQLQQLGIGRFNPNEDSGDKSLRMKVVRKVPVSPDKDIMIPGGRPGHAKPGTIGELLPPDPSWDPSPDAPTTTSWPGKVTGSSGSGDGPWTYTVSEVEQAAPGYSEWGLKPGGKSGTAYNFAEDTNIQVKDHIKNDTIVLVREIGDRLWFQAYNVEVGRVFPVIMAMTSGVTGSESVKCAYLYTVTDAITSVELATNVDVDSGNHKWVRPTVGYMIAATFGHAHYDASYNLVISWINEVADQEAC